MARLIALIFLIVLLALVAVFAVAGPELALSDEASPSASPSPSASATTAPEPAGAGLVKTAREWRSSARAARETLCRVRHCFKAKAPVALAAAPPRSAPAEVWSTALQRWKHQSRDWWPKAWRGRREMLHPGGSSNGGRWLPLARWVGWPERALGNLAYIIMRESSGRERAYNSVIGCSGLLQIWPGNLRAGESRADLFHAEFNLRVGLRLYRECGWSPWAL